MPTFRVEYTVTLSCSTEIEAENMTDAEAEAGIIDRSDSDVESEDLTIELIHEI